ncbi:class I fructose-bisphosphate aldolase family protein [Aetokthonos hydrillicola Thurmond2011]|jgi:predicted phospho-2-dehydro-3-deoxyheptonate aldolase|uniref:Class I fructose-bisphosphate aldolase family protein n=2 Tax=Aetokthonos TaxID=1550243 RepID=A0AAP5MA52_9CYAN|nr:class I fructose-bisphosphate aldolase family protein [Aetokthonos hydrillicola Thurmond2011]
MGMVPSGEFKPRKICQLQCNSDGNFMMLGKKSRLSRILKKQSNYFIVPIDHGLTVGPISHLADVKSFINSLPGQVISAVIAHKGLADSISPLLISKNISLILHLSGSTNLSRDPSSKRLVSSIEYAIKLNADAVSVHINLGANDEPKMLQDFGLISEECDKWGMPLLAMMYCRGEKIPNEYDVQAISHATRIAWELGADIVKVNYTGSLYSFKEVVQAVDIPVVIAGGPKASSDNAVLSMVKESIEAGGRGVAFGRNIFQHSAPHFISGKIATILNHSSLLELQESGA